MALLKMTTSWGTDDKEEDQELRVWDWPESRWFQAFSQGETLLISNKWFSPYNSSISIGGFLEPKIRRSNNCRMWKPWVLQTTGIPASQQQLYDLHMSHDVRKRSLTKEDDLALSIVARSSNNSSNFGKAAVTIFRPSNSGSSSLGLAARHSPFNSAVVSWGTEAREINGSEPEYCVANHPYMKLNWLENWIQNKNDQSFRSGTPNWTIPVLAVFSKEMNDFWTYSIWEISSQPKCTTSQRQAKRTLCLQR